MGQCGRKECVGLDGMRACRLGLRLRRCSMHSLLLLLPRNQGYVLRVASRRRGGRTRAYWRCQQVQALAGKVRLIEDRPHVECRRGLRYLSSILKLCRYGQCSEARNVRMRKQRGKMSKARKPASLCFIRMDLW